MKLSILLASLLLLTGCVSKTSFDEAKSQAQGAQATASALESELASSQADLKQTSATATALSDENSQLQADLSKARSDYQSTSRQVQQLTSRVDKLMCNSQITDMKYDNVMDASTILAAWWARQPGVESVNTPYRDKIWSNALSQLHGIRYVSSDDHKPYVEHFMVYFNNEFGMKAGVFWIKGQCWLDAP